MAISRRAFLYTTGPLAAVPLLPKQCSELYVNATTPFLHGVASGDPTSDGVVLWTRVTGDSGAPRSFEVVYEIAEDPELSRVISRGSVATDAELDFTAKVDVAGLRSGRTYYYRFQALGHASPIGRTRTLPKRQVARARFAVASCSNYPYGYFNAYAAIARRADLDAVLHLGDYLYEYANGVYGDGTVSGRVPEPDKETITLEDYRKRHASYKTDPDLQEAHRQHPFIPVWDDHESANDAWQGGAENHQPADEGEWEARKAAAQRAYFEWMPIRGLASDATGRIYRSFRFGSLADLIMLDTRLVGRDQQIEDPCDATGLGDPERKLLGEEQETWLKAELTASKRRGTSFRFLGQQVMFGQLVNVLAPGACVFNPDQWDGYAASRERVLDFLRQEAIENVVVLTGDIHSSWAMDVTANPFEPARYDRATGAGSVAVEFVAPAVTSPGIEDPVQAAQFAGALLATHPHVKFVELNRRGYLLLDVTHERVQAEWYHLATIAEPSTDETLAAIFAVRAGDNHLSPSTAPSVPVENPPPLAPVLDSLNST
jgi:alkaline phosphatase D